MGGMDFAGAPRTLHVAGRLVGALALVMLLALAFASVGAHAQVQAPAYDAPPQTAPVPSVAPGNALNLGHSGGSKDWLGEAAQPDPSPLLGGVDDGASAPSAQELPSVMTSYVAGRVARLRTDGRAAVPRGAPRSVRSLIKRYNRIIGLRYKWGGGHARVDDNGYDCSGAVGYGLIKDGLLTTTMVSGSFARWGAAGFGRWVTVYAHQDHVYTEVAGLRLDTSPVGDGAGLLGVRWRPPIGRRRGFAVRHPVGL
jgi:hypothetical protein